MLDGVGVDTVPEKLLNVERFSTFEEANMIGPAQRKQSSVPYAGTLLRFRQA
jgi:hypothetical protein